MENDFKSFLDRRALGCSEVEELLDAYVDGEMPPLMTERFEAHLESCELCRSLVEDCRHLMSVARSLADTPIPKEVSERLREALRVQVGHQVETRPVKLTLVKSDQDS